MTETVAVANDRTNNSEDHISLLDLLIALAKHKLLVLGFPIVVAVIVAGYTFTLPNVYTASAKIIPPQSGQSGASGLLAQLGGLAGLAGGLPGLRTQNDLYIGMLKSRTVADNIVERFNLMQQYGANRPSQARAGLAGATTILTGKEGIISIEVDDIDPKRAADLANAYVDELLKLTNVLAVTDASQRRLFFERQFEQARDNLTKAEVAARQAMDKGGLVQVEGQGRTLLEASARLRGQITVKEVQIGAMRSFASDRNPDMRFAQKELEALKAELAKTEGATGGNADNVKKGRGSGIDNLGLLRNVKYYETIYELLAKQFEVAKIEEAKESAVVQVMDKAIEPDFKSKPNRRNIVLLSALAAGFLAILIAFLREALAKAQQDPMSRERINRLRSYLAIR